jgi:glyoxylase-like metal-dependent hydrolase (beta-lactamase superfamily II)
MANIDLIMPGFSLATDQGSVAFCGVTLIEGTTRILVDVAHTGRRPLLLQKLAERGLTPNDIDYVFLTHSHWDHMLNIDLFPKAKVLIHPLEREYAKQPHPNDYATATYTSMILESHQLQEVREGDELDDGISVIETPGHSRGSMALLVRGDAETSAITGDALANGWSAISGLPRLVFWDEGDAKASIRKLLDCAAVFYPGS